MTKNEDYIDPLTLLDQVNREWDAFPMSQLFSPSNQHLRDRWCAAMFGIALNEYFQALPSSKVKWNPIQDSSVDFFLRRDGKTFEFQTVEVLDPQRKRGDEYKQSEKEGFVFKPIRFERGTKNGPDWIANEIQKKVKKETFQRYTSSENLNLLVCLSFSALEMPYELLKERLIQFKSNFASVWLITNLSICSIFSNPDLKEIPGVFHLKTLQDRKMREDLGSKQEN